MDSLRVRREGLKYWLKTSLLGRYLGMAKKIQKTRKARCPKCCPNVRIDGWILRGSHWECHNCGYEAPVVKRERKLIDAHGIQMTPEQSTVITAVLKEAGQGRYQVTKFEPRMIGEHVFVSLHIADSTSKAGIFDVFATLWVGPKGILQLILGGGSHKTIRPDQVVLAHSYEREARDRKNSTPAG